jgi:hypothetical protein
MVNWHLMSDLEEGWTVVMRESANTIDHDCFKPPADGWVLKKKGDSVSSGPTYCEEGASWKYDVVLKQGNSEHDKVDPLFFLPFN